MVVGKPRGQRALKTIDLRTDLVVIGGGLAGTCCAITAARKGIQVVLIQDRPVLGGNASSEVRLWALGATSHMGNNNRWAREGGVIDEILVDNLFRNREGNALILDTILLEKVWEEKNITLLLNTSVYETHKSSPDCISSVRAFCSQNSTEYQVSAPFFCDASGDGIVGFQSGAAFRMGAESAEEFGEPFAPSKEYGELLGHSMYFMTKDIGKPVNFVAPKYALKDITKIPRYHKFNVEEHGCWLWWIEYGGRLDTVHDTEAIKWELWKVIYGVWDYIKNSGKFPEAENMTLEWVSQIPGKRESRRFEGPYILKQSDLVEQVHFDDTVSYGGWAIDLHPADGIFSEKPGCNQWHSKGIYEIPYRAMISKNIKNLLLAGRIISASHIAFGSTRVMLTCAHGAQAAGMVAALAVINQWSSIGFLHQEKIKILQQELLKMGQHIPHVPFIPKQTGPNFTISATSCLTLSEIPFDGPWKNLVFGKAQLIPLDPGSIPTFHIEARADQKTVLEVSLRRSSKPFNYTPDLILNEQKISLNRGEERVKLQFDAIVKEASYFFLCFHKNDHVQIRESRTRVTGILSVFNKQNISVSNFGKQEPDPALGFESFEFWTPSRRPEGHNVAMSIQPELNCFGMENLTNGFHRPYLRPNAWVANLNDPCPELKMEWTSIKSISSIILFFDTDADHPMESTLLGHPENHVPFVVREYEVLDDAGNVVFVMKGNYQTRNEIRLGKALATKQLVFRFTKPSENVPVTVFGIYIY